MTLPEPRWLMIDTSALVRSWRYPEVAAAIERWAGQRVCVISPTTMLELGHTTQSGQQWNQLMDNLGGLPVVEVTPEAVEKARYIQGALWNNGKVRAAGPADILTAACAIVCDAGVLHYDADFEAIGAVSGLEHIWVAPRGSLD